MNLQAVICCSILLLPCSCFLHKYTAQHFATILNIVNRYFVPPQASEHHIIAGDKMGLRTPHLHEFSFRQILSQLLEASTRFINTNSITARTITVFFNAYDLQAYAVPYGSTYKL